MSETLGVGILTYYGPEEAMRSVRSVQEHGRSVSHILVFDNSENDEVGACVRDSAPDVAYVRSPYNCGCSRGRNAQSSWFIARGVNHFVLQDEDVTWVGDAAAAMRAVFARAPDTGIVSWPLFTKQMSPAGYIDRHGVVPEAPGACSMFSVACVKAVGGWDPRILFYRFDTLFCLKAAKAGFKTRLVWPDTNLVRHPAPHRGIRRQPRWRAEQKRSMRIFAEEVERHGLSVPAGL